MLKKQEPSARVIYVALLGNVSIAVAKVAAFAASSSSAMLTEAIHSFVDSLDQVLLLIGHARARKRRDGSHPLGYGMETYFWSFVVAVMVMLAGGITSLYQGVHRILAPEPVSSPAISLAVLAIAVVFEGASFVVGYREYKRIVRGSGTRLWTFIRMSKDPNLFTTLLEDSAALIGVGFAAAAVIASSAFHWYWADGLASIGIGLLLVAVAIVLANETRSLIAGEAVAPPVLARLRAALAADEHIEEVHEIATLHLGPRVIMVALTVSFPPEMRVSELRMALREVTATLKTIDERIAYVYVRPNHTH